MSPRHIVVDVFLWLGVVLILIACVGMVVMRSVYDRLHFTSPALLGTLSVAVAVLVQESFSLVGNKTLLIAVLLILVAPLLTQATGRAARVREHGDWRLQPDEPVEVEEE
jgi:monovalent cation/proton antiporter MnhG/PhaG subunit